MSILNESASKHSVMKERNLRLLIEHFRNDTFSTFSIGKQIGLSTGGAKKLVDEIVEGGLLVRAPSGRVHAQGRTPQNYAINKDYGSIFTINYADYTVTLRDLVGNVIESASLGSGAVDNDHVYRTAARMREMLAAHPECKLAVIAIAFVGRVNKKYGTYFSAQFADCSINLEKYFHSEFGVDVIIENDINFAILAERRGGVLSTLDGTEKSICLLSVGRGVACSMMIDDKLYTGASGFAGEIGHNADLGATNDIAEHFMDWSAIGHAISCRRAAGEKTTVPEGCTFDAVVEAYLAGDALVCDVVDGTTKHVARLINNMLLFMDFDTIVLSGMVLAFGDRYVENVKKALSEIEHPYGSYAHVDIIVSRGSEELIEYGAFEAARDKVFERFVEMRVKKEKNAINEREEEK